MPSTCSKHCPACSSSRVAPSIPPVPVVFLWHMFSVLLQMAATMMAMPMVTCPPPGVQVRALHRHMCSSVLRVSLPDVHSQWQ
jgi:hypothetical protein